MYLLPTSEEVVNFARTVHKVKIPPTMWGYTFAYDSSIVIRLSGGMGTVGHEVFHTLLNFNFPEAPPWLNEGYSALFEEFEIVDEKMKGKYREDHWRIPYLSWNPDGPPLIADLISMDWRTFDGQETWISEKIHINHTEFTIIRWKKGLCPATIRIIISCFK